jgi:hypothetical protein
MSCTVQGAFAEPVGSKSHLYADQLRKNLLKSVWKAIYNRLQIDRLPASRTSSYSSAPSPHHRR